MLLQRSLLAQQSWLALIPNEDHSYLFDTNRGSLLIGKKAQREELMKYFWRSKNKLKDLSWVESVKSEYNSFIQDGICGIHYPHDFTCSPTKIISYLQKRERIRFECRSVLDLSKEMWDLIVCCTGPWISELEPRLNVKPVRGVLLQAPCSPESIEYTPMMEYGYGTPGVHFTLSFRQDDNQKCLALLGASRREIGFSLDDLESDAEAIVAHAQDFVEADCHVLDFTTKTIGFRPAVPGSAEPYQIDVRDDIIFVYGFEGQGVLYSALAAKEVAQIVTRKLTS